SITGWQADSPDFRSIGPLGILESLPVAVYACNRSGKIIYFNEAAVNLWGFRPDVDDPLLKFCACHKVFVDGAYIPPDQTPMAVTITTGKTFKDVQAVVQRPDGSSFQALVNIQPLYDHN